MKTPVTQYLVLLVVALLLVSGSAPVTTVQAQAEPSTLYLPSLHTADILRTAVQTETVVQPEEIQPDVLPPGFSLPPGITRIEDLPFCYIPTPEEAMAFEEEQRRRIAANGGTDPLDAQGVMDRTIRCRYDMSKAQPMGGPVGDPLDYLVEPQEPPVNQSDKPQADTSAWVQYDMYNKNYLGIYADWLYAEPTLSSGTWSNYDHFVRLAAGSSSQSAACGGLAKLLVGVIKGRPGDTWPFTAYTPELAYLNQGIGGCTFIQSGHYASTGEYVAFKIWRSGNDWYMGAYIDDSWQGYSGPYTTGWTNNYAGRVAAGYEIFAEDGYSLSTIHQPTKSVGSGIALYPVGYNWRTWSDFDLPSGYTYQTSLTTGSPWQFRPNGMAGQYGAIRAHIP
jgi:hypothetical protein